jgi:adhesin/invasin
MRLVRRPHAFLLLLAAPACGGGDLVLPNEGQPAEVAVVSGDGQTGTILEPAAESLVVRVSDRFGNPVAGAEVVWSAEGGGEVTPAQTVTGTDGRAAVQRRLGPQPGTYGTTAVATSLPEDVATFTTTAVAAKLVLVTQPGAVASSGAPFDPQPVLQLQDASGSPLARPGVTVTAQISSGEGGLRGTTIQTSDADGVVTFTDLAIVGPPGSRTLIFAASGYASAASTPVSLGVGAPAAVAAAAGDGQSAPAGTKVPVAPSVVVRDAGGTPVPGVGVTFAVASGGGSVEGALAITGADGVAAVGSWTLGGNLGANTLTATVTADGVSGNPVTFTATAVPGTPSGEKSSVTASPGSIAASDGADASTITVVVRDGRGNPIAGQAVSLEATGTGVALAQPGPTDGSGTTTARFSATGAGQHAITATAAGTVVGRATVTVNPGPPVASAAAAIVPAGTAGSPTVVALTLRDRFANPVSGAAGQVGVAVAGANPVARVNVEDRGGGDYRAAYTPIRTGTDQVDVRVNGEPIPGSPFASAVAPGPADPGHTTALVPDGVFGQSLEILVSAADAQGNPVGRGGDQVGVTVVGIQTLTVQDAGDGTYRAAWRPLTFGTFRVEITLNGTPISGSPYTLRVSLFQ